MERIRISRLNPLFVCLICLSVIFALCLFFALLFLLYMYKRDPKITFIEENKEHVLIESGYSGFFNGKHYYNARYGVVKETNSDGSARLYFDCNLFGSKKYAVSDTHMFYLDFDDRLRIVNKETHELVASLQNIEDFYLFDNKILTINESEGIYLYDTCGNLVCDVYPGILTGFSEYGDSRILYRDYLDRSYYVYDLLTYETTPFQIYQDESIDNNDFIRITKNASFFATEKYIAFTGDMIPPYLSVYSIEDKTMEILVTPYEPIEVNSFLFGRYRIIKFINSNTVYATFRCVTMAGLPVRPTGMAGGSWKFSASGNFSAQKISKNRIGQWVSVNGRTICHNTRGRIVYCETAE